MISNQKHFSFFIFLFLSVWSIPLVAQKKKDQQRPGPFAHVKSLEEVTAKTMAFDGLFTVYQDSATGKSYMLIKEEQLEKEYIYFSHTVDGVRDAGFFRGNYNKEKVFKISRYFDKIEFTLENTAYYFDPANPISKAADANINKPTILSLKILGVNEENNAFLVDADLVFLGENFQQVKPSSSTSKLNAFTLGTLSRDKTKLVQVKNYPQNTDVVVEYVFESLYPSSQGHASVTDSRFVGVKIQHSIVEMPQNNFKPRFDDPRVGYFTQKVDDMTSTRATPYKDVVYRWHLEKKNKKAKLSEPVEPIAWWIENTTPKEYRKVIKDAVLQWNIAFEAAGFKNALVVYEQPDDADWDAGDIRYNVIRWTSSPQPAFGGYGPSFVNPRTGQILGADIMLEYIFLTNRLKEEKVFQTAALDFLQSEHGHDASGEDQHYCQFGSVVHNNMLLGTQILKSRLADANETEEFMRQAIYMLVLHEVGHTLGLNHNMKASHYLSPDDLNNKTITHEKGIAGSVMDYTSVNIATEKEKQGLYYSVKPGPYDIWAIEFGYSESLPNEMSEFQRLQKILSKSTLPGHDFGNDADDMRRSGKGIDPRVMVGDMSNDPITYAISRVGLVNKAFPALIEHYAVPGQSYHELRNAYMVLTSEYANSLRVISRQIGGVYVDRSFAGQENAARPFEPVSYGDQKRAMAALAEHAFSPRAFDFPNDIYNYLQIQRRGFSHAGYNEDPKIHGRVLNIQADIFSHLLNQSVMKRISDSELYGNKYNLSEMMEDLTNAVFQEDVNATVSSIRQNLQIEYVDQLIGILSPAAKYDNISQSVAFFELVKIKQMMQKAVSPDSATKAHRLHVIHKIDKAIK
jgi:hypothetical protein